MKVVSGQRARCEAYDEARAAKGLHPFELVDEAGQRLGWLDTAFVGQWGIVHVSPRGILSWECTDGQNAVTP